MKKSRKSLTVSELIADEVSQEVRRAREFKQAMLPSDLEAWKRIGKRKEKLDCWRESNPQPRDMRLGSCSGLIKSRRNGYATETL